jgi:hypothetical protein
VSDAWLVPIFYGTVAFCSLMCAIGVWALIKLPVDK